MVCGYISFGPGVASNVLQSLPRDILSSAAQFAMAVCIFGCFPLNVKPCVAPFVRPSPAGGLNTPLMSPGAHFGSPLGLPMPRGLPVIDEQRGDVHKGTDATAYREVIATIALVVMVAVCSLWIHNLGALNAI